MKVHRPPLPSTTSNRPARRWAGALLALLAAAAPARADHFYNSWTTEFDTSSSNGQDAAAVATDSRGNVVICGETIINSTQQIYVAKYDGLDGELLWSYIVGTTHAATLQATPNDNCVARSIVVDHADNVIVGGGAIFNSTNNEDFETLKFSPSGVLQWARSLGGTGRDEIQKVAVDASNNVYVTGVSAASSTGDDFLTVKYDINGTLKLQVRYNNTGNSAEFPTDLAVNQSSGNVWVTGKTTAGDGAVSFVTIQYDNTGAVVNNFPIIYTTPYGFTGASAIVLDSVGTAFITGTYIDGSGSRGLYTAKYGSTGIPFWTDIYTGLSSDDQLAFAGSIAIGPDDNPVVTGAVDTGDNFGNTEAVTIKYQGAGFSAVRLWTKLDTGISPEDPNHPGFPQFSTEARKIAVDGANNVTVIGDSQAVDTDPSHIYVARYSGTDGSPLFSAASNFASVELTDPDKGVGVAVDQGGNISVVATESRPLGDSSAVDGILTQQYHRIIAETADALPPDPANQKARTISALNAPALADSGDLAARITLAEGTTKLAALLTQISAGGSELPVVQKQAAPGVPGFGSATFASFGDPVIAPSGDFAFPATLAGVPASKAKSLWTSIGGTLRLALQVGTPVPGLTSVNVASIVSVSLRTTVVSNQVVAQLVALVKTSGPAGSDMVLLGLNNTNAGTVLLRTGPQNPLTVNGAASYIKTLTVLTPATSSPGDGRWQGDTATVAKAVLADKRTVLFMVSPSGTVTPLLYSAEAAGEVASNATWKTFGLPTVGNGGTDFAALGTINTETGVNATDDTAIVYSAAGSSYSLIAREGSAAAGGLTGISYAGFSDPITNAHGSLAFLATLKETTGSGVRVLATNNRALFYGNTSGQQVVARTGEDAPDITGTPGTATYSSFVSFALPGGTPGMPIFVAKLAGHGVTAKNNLGVWGVDSTGTVRQVLRTGEKLGTQTVTGITLLKGVAQEFGAARSFNADGSVVMLVAFSDHSTGLLEIQLP